MDTTKLLCPTLSVVLVKTIKALCEINIKYDAKLEITGSLHVRSDGQKVLTCLLDEESVKGQHDAARIAELATRLSMAAATFPFAHLQIPNAVNHHNHVAPQQVAAELYLSSTGGDVHLVNANVQQSVAMQVERVASLRDDSQQQQLQTVLPQQLAVGLGTNAQLTTAVYHHHLHLKQPDSTAAVQMLVQESNEEIRINQAAVRPFDGLVSKQLPAQQPTSHQSKKSKHYHQQTQQQQQQQQQQQVPVDQNKVTLTLKGSPPSSLYDGRNCGGALAAAVSQNHIKLPDIQTLAHSLPKYPSQKIKAGVVASFIDSSGHQIAAVDLQSTTKCIENLATTYIPHNLHQHLQQQQQQQQQQHQQQLLQQQLHQQQQQGHEQPDSTPPALEGPPSAECLSKDGTGGNVSTNSNNIAAASEADLAISRRKKFQCMFCGIFLSTKCYLKNHVNAVHTRARVYPCELCERFFYSAGALRIHKLRNHWHGAKKHVCTQCGETFLLPIELRKHLVKKHLVDTNEGNAAAAAISRQFKMEDADLPMPQLHPENLEATLLSDSLVGTPSSACYSAPDLRSSPQQTNSDPPSLVDDSQMA